MICRRDGSTLEPTEFLGITMDSCPYCDGTWLDAGELSRIHGLESDLHEEGLEADDPRGPISCLRCGVQMTTRWFSSERKILIDRCLMCGGIWLDAEEMKRILEESYRRQRS